MDGQTDWLLAVWYYVNMAVTNPDWPPQDLGTHMKMIIRPISIHSECENFAAQSNRSVKM